jgi:hypothetical protein
MIDMILYKILVMVMVVAIIPFLPGIRKKES